ncbi:MAG: glycosyltransferase [Bacilli bacterium]|nr:glycosyltransferase [Bacilli bacterium]
MKKLVSVIIPSYNHEKYIKECIMSVLNQTYKNLEVFVMDDCSTDNSQKVIKSIKDDRFKAFYSKKNKGTVRTVNELMNKCSGDYIAVIGSDDIWEKSKIEKQVDFLDNNKSVGAVFSAAEIIDENNNIYEDDYDFNHNVFNNENIKRGERMRYFFEKGNHLCHSSSLIRKSVVDKIGLYNVSYMQLHDYDYWVRLINNFDIYILDEKLVKYRRFKKNKKNLSNNSTESLIRVVNENNMIISWMFNNMNKDIFIDGFKDLFVDKESQSNKEILCEKYFILLKYKFFGVINRQLAFSLIYNYSDKDSLFRTLEKKFNYTINSFYHDTGKTYDVFNFDIVNDRFSETGKTVDEMKKTIELQTNIIDTYKDRIVVLESNINALKSSTSWKITKPLRKIKGLIRNGK